MAPSARPVGEGAGQMDVVSATLLLVSRCMWGFADMGGLPARRTLPSSEIAGVIAAVRRETLRRIVILLAVAFLLWQFGVPILDPTIAGSLPALMQRWTLLVCVGLCLGGTYLVSERWPHVAGAYFLTAGTLTVTAALWLLQAPLLTFLYPLTVLVAVALVQPLSGLAVGVAALGLLLLLRVAGAPPFLSGGLLGEAAFGMLLAGMLGGALNHTIVVAVEWSEHSLAKASRNAEDAQHHRGQVVRALQQLDDAYYRLRQANAALEVAWKAADAAERSKSEFVTNISHELRTPLNLIVGFSEMVVTSPESYGAPLPPEYRGDLNAIYRSAKHLLTLTDDVLDLARIGAGRLALAREPVDLGQAIGDAADLVREYVHAKGLQLSLTVAPELPLISLDRLRIRQVLLNLVTNAARFTEHGGIAISATLEDDYVLVRVIDTGKGIASMDLPRVFDEFHQGEPGPSHGSPQQGYGLGLPISKRLVELHGGTMGVESRVGAGTTFWFTLPINLVDAPYDPLRPTDLGWLSGHGDRVLVLAGAGDQFAHVLRRQLPGYRLAVAEDLPSAQELATELRALAILADQGSFDPASCLSSPVPVLGLPLAKPERLSAGLGVAAYLSKPVQRADLLAAIRRLPQPIRTLLVIDDDPQFVRLVRRFLRSRTDPDTYTVWSAHTSEEALATARSRHPDLILLDLVLPGAGGVEILGRLKQVSGMEEAPVIMVSAQEQLAGELALGTTLSLLKPEGLRLDEVCRAIEALVQSLEPPRRYLRIPASPVTETG